MVARTSALRGTDHRPIPDRQPQLKLPIPCMQESGLQQPPPPCPFGWHGSPSMPQGVQTCCWFPHCEPSQHGVASEHGSPSATQRSPVVALESSFVVPVDSPVSSADPVLVALASSPDVVSEGSVALVSDVSSVPAEVVDGDVVEALSEVDAVSEADALFDVDALSEADALFDADAELDMPLVAVSDADASSEPASDPLSTGSPSLVQPASHNEAIISALVVMIQSPPLEFPEPGGAAHSKR